MITRRPAPKRGAQDRRPLAAEEILAVWLVDRTGALLSKAGRLLSFRGARGRSVKRRYLAGAGERNLGESRTAAIAEVGRFLVDPTAFAADDPALPSWPLGGLADAEVAWTIRGQAHALAGRHRAAVRCMIRALRLLLEPDRRPTSALWIDGLQVPTESPRSQQARRELAAILLMFVAGEVMAARRPRAALEFARQACKDQPGIAYLHEIRAELAYDAGRYGDVLDALDRASALRGDGATADGRSNAALLAASAAFQAVHWVNEPDEGAQKLVLRALARMATLQPGTVRTARDGLVTYWKALLLLERARAGGPAGEADRAAALQDLEMLGRPDLELDDDSRARAAAWTQVARGKPWLALHEGLAGRPADRDAAIETGLRMQAGFGNPPAKQRLVIRYSEDSSLDPARSRAIAERLIGQEGARDPGDDVAVPSLAALNRLLLARYGVAKPTALLQRVTDGPLHRVDVLLDGTPLGSAEVDWSEARGSWFGQDVLLPPDTEGTAAHPAHIVLVAAQMVLRYLDRLLDAGHALALGLDGRPYRAWSPTLRLLLADRTPLTERAALHAAVDSVECGSATPLQAAERYRALPALRPRLWGAEPERTGHDLPAAFAAALAPCVPRNPGQGAAGVPDRLARDIEEWASRATTDRPGAARVVVEDPALRPWLRVLLRARHPELPVLARHEVDPA